MKTIIYLAALVGAAVALSSCAANRARTLKIAQAASKKDLENRARNQGELSVLFIGNSYSFGVPAGFAKLAASHGRKVHVDQATYNGWSLARHSKNAETLGKIRSRRWDVVVLQEYSRTPSLIGARSAVMYPNVNRLAGEARRQGAVPVLYQTWGYRNGDPKLPGDDFTNMTRRIRQGYRAAARDAGGLVVAPVGDAWEREVLAGRGGRLFQEDDSHPTSAGNALTAKVIYETIFGIR